tara:strand:- start:1314 stop:2354 length:1041 start_codon:yes stop_codon:yes gene_type:complete
MISANVSAFSIGKAVGRGGGGGDLYDFSSFTFSHGTATSRVPNSPGAPRNTTRGDYVYGNTKSQFLAVYDTTVNPWLDDSSFYDVEGAGNGVQKWTVPSSGDYKFTVKGAAGGSQNGAGYAGGNGAQIIATLSLTEGDIIRMLAGKRGEDTYTGNKKAGAGGGGGTFVFGSLTDTEPLLVAGGGGGSQKAGVGSNASTSTSGTVGTANGHSGELGGTSGNMGNNVIDGNYDSGSGAGWKSGNGEITLGNDATIGYAPKNGGWGGYRSSDSSDDWGGHGGFGGGGGGTTQNGAGGGAGGYSGGGGGSANPNYSGGGGGGSYITPSATNTAVSILGAINHGSILVQKL